MDKTGTMDKDNLSSGGVSTHSCTSGSLRITATCWNMSEANGEMGEVINFVINV